MPTLTSLARVTLIITVYVCDPAIMLQGTQWHLVA